MKICKRCQAEKPESGFYKQRTSRDGLQGTCKACHAVRFRERWSSRTEGEKERRRARWRDIYSRNPLNRRYDRKRTCKKYGITAEEYERRVLEQGGRCAICLQPPTNTGLCIDHSHSTGEVRGLLCRECNVAIGMFRDDLSRIRQAAEYLRRQEKLAVDGAFKSLSQGVGGVAPSGPTLEE
jgi:hypothetical protein